MKYTCLVLIFASAYLCSEAADINPAVDRVLERTDRLLRAVKLSSIPTPPFRLNANISWSEGTLVGRDSLVRTENCTASQEGSALLLDLHIGFRLWVQTFREMIIHGEVSSVFFRIRKNSMHLAFTVDREKNCEVKIKDYRFEALEDVEFGSSLSRLDGANVEEVFRNGILPMLNKITEANKPRMERTLHMLCLKKKNGLDSSFDEESILQEAIQFSFLNN